MTGSEDPALDLLAMQAALGLDEDGPVEDGRGPEFAAARAFWEARFAPLLDVTQPVAPSASLWDRIAADTVAAQAAVQTRPRADSDRAPLARRLFDSLALWRIATAGALAAALVLALLGPMRRQFEPGPALVAVLQSPGEARPGYLVQVAADRSVRLTPIGETRVPDGRALQFWTKADSDPGPTSLGLVSGKSVTRVAFPGAVPKPGQLFEVTLEPATGSPIGRPTGPILFIGRALVPEDAPQI